MNKLQEWEKRENEKRLRELKRAGIILTLENIPGIVEFMSFRKRSQREADCPYYNQGRSCHPEIKDLNCFLCACPQYESEKQEGGCKIKSTKGFYIKSPISPKGIYWDCSDCAAFHSPRSVEIYLRKNIEKLRKMYDSLKE
jgi:Zn-finger protein